MIFFVTAMYHEASPVIFHYKMKKNMELKSFQVFTSEQCVLIISGVGAYNASTATAFLLVNYPPTKNDILVNLGICGSLGFYKQESILFCHKVVDMATGFVYYPDCLVNHPFDETTLLTVPKPLAKADIDGNTRCIVDMEGAAIYHSALFFLPNHAIHLVKVVSDCMEPADVTAGYVSKIIQHTVGRLGEWLVKRMLCYGEEAFTFSETERKSMDEIILNYKLTVSMSHEFSRLAKAYKLRTGKLDSLLEQYKYIMCNTKSEGKIQYAKLTNKLME